jgi:hypothetical protein
LNENDLAGLLKQPLVGKLATQSSKGEIRISPVWFGAEPDGSILMNTFEDSGMVKNIGSNPKCSLMVDTTEFPYIGVHYWGTASVEGPANDVEGMARLFASYRGGEQVATEYAKQLISWGKRVYVRFRPQRNTTWDFRQG